MTQQTNSIAPMPATRSGAGWFCLTSLAFLVLGSLMLAGRPTFLMQPVLTGHGLSWVFLMLYGCALTGLYGLVYWALPSIYRVPLYSSHLAMLHFAFHVTGSLLIVAGLLFPDIRATGMGPTFVACGALAFVVNLAGTLRAVPRPDVTTTAISASALWLMVVVFLGVPFAKEAPIGILEGRAWSAAWLVFCLTGVFVNTLLGLAFQIGAKAVGTPAARSDAPWYALAFTNGGLAWLFGATAFGPMSFVIVCAAVYLAGIVIFLAVFWSILQRRPEASMGWDTRMLLCAVASIPVAGAIFLFGVWQRLAAPVAEAVAEGAELATTEGPLPVEFLPSDGAALLTVMLAIIVTAWVALMFQLFRISRDGAETGLRERLSGQILLAAFFNYATGVLMIIPGAWAGVDRIVGLGTLFLLVGAAGFLGNFLFMQSNRPLGQAAPVEAPVS